MGGGWGGRPFEDGASASVSMCQGDVKNTPIELQELYYPLMYECHALRTDSGGARKISRRYRRRGESKAAAGLFLSRNTDRIQVPALGLARAEKQGADKSKR